MTDPEQYQAIVDAEWKIIYDKLDKIVEYAITSVSARTSLLS